MAADKWKNASIRTIKVAQTLMARAENDLEDAIAKDSLPTLRDRCVRETNRRIHDYTRSVRAVVVRLRQSFVAVNEQMKSMNRTKESLYRSLNATRRMLTINIQAFRYRQERPLREKKLPDAADESLQLEYEQLLGHKQQTESQLHAVVSCLQVLSQVRANISSVLQERARVTDLLCHSVSSCQSRKFSTDGRLLGNSSSNRHIKSLSAPAKSLEDIGVPDEVTPAVRSVLSDGDKAIADSQRVKLESLALIDELSKQQDSLRDTVHQHIIQRIAQTATLAQHLIINSGETKATLQASQKYMNEQEKSLGYTMGPVSSRDLTTRERLDRPLVKVYQSHPKTDLPEASYITDATHKLTDSINTTQRNIALLKLARRKMKEDTRDKQLGMDVDSYVLRMRKREGKKRMLMLGTPVVTTLKIVNKVA